MLVLLKVLWFSQVILLTPNAIDIDDHLSLSLNSPISAITTRATVEIDISYLSDEIGVQDLDIIEWGGLLDKLLPAGSVVAELRNKDKTVVLNRMNFAYANSSIRLILSASDGVPTGIDFNVLDIKTNVPLESVTVTWINYGL